MELDHENLSRRYDDFEEDLSEEDDIEEQLFSENPTPTSSVIELLEEDLEVSSLLELTRAKSTEYTKRYLVENLWSVIG